MKFAALALTIGSAAALSTDATEYLLGERFAAFKAKHNKVYAADEEPIRKKHFEATVEKITTKNAELVALGHDAIHGITRVSLKMTLLGFVYIFEQAVRAQGLCQSVSAFVFVCVCANSGRD